MGSFRFFHDTRCLGGESVPFWLRHTLRCLFWLGYAATLTSQCKPIPAPASEWVDSCQVLMSTFHPPGPMETPDKSGFISEAPAIPCVFGPFGLAGCPWPSLPGCMARAYRITASKSRHFVHVVRSCFKSSLSSCSLMQIPKKKMGRWIGDHGS